MEGKSQAVTMPNTSAGAQARDEAQTSTRAWAQGTQAPQAHHVVVAPRTLSQQVLSFAQPMAPRLAMTFEEQKMLGLFIKLGPPRFTSVVGENIHKFPLNFHERLHNLGFVESHWVDYTTYQLEDPAKQ